jgi:CelD/BcsL family acetyltransferase involved in cellulose biosynthesis
VSTICVDPATDPIWLKLLERHDSNVFHSPQWLRVLGDTYGLETRAHVMLDGTGEPLASLPFCKIADIIGDRIAILPFSDYCDPLVDNGIQWNSLAETLLNNNLPVAIRCLHNEVPLADRRFQLMKQAKWHGMDLRPDIDTLWRGLHESSRRAIHKAQREGVVVRIAQGRDELRAFYDMHLRIRKYKYRLLAQPFRFFENIWHQFAEKQSGILLVAIHRGEIIGGVMFLEWNNKLYYKFNASVPADLAYRPNDFLIWEGIQYGKSKGYSFLDFGLSDWDQEGLVRYKRKFATEEKAISFLRYMPDLLPSASEKQGRDLLNQLADLLTDPSAPDSVTERAGELLYRFFI